MKRRHWKMSPLVLVLPMLFALALPPSAQADIPPPTPGDDEDGDKGCSLPGSNSGVSTTGALVAATLLLAHRRSRS